MSGPIDDALAKVERCSCEETEALRKQLDAVYLERNRLVALLARVFPSERFDTDVPGWDPEWRGCCFVWLPTGQASWHYHSRELPLFEGVTAAGRNPWDGHSTDEKYRRVERLIASIDAHGLEPRWLRRRP